MARFVFVLTLTFSLLLACSAQATVITHSSYVGMDAARTAWLGSMGITQPDYTLNFETGFTEGQDVRNVSLAGGLVITSPKTAFVSSDSGDMGKSSPIDTFGMAIKEDTVYTLDFSAQPIAYFALYRADVHTTVTINYADGSASETFAFGGSGTGGHEGKFDTFDFEGKMVSSIQLDTNTPGDGKGVFDNIQYGVPEPISLLLLGVGGLLLRRRNAR